MKVRAFYESKFQIFFTIVFVLFMSGAACVSVNIGAGKTAKSSGVNFSPPGAGFKEIKNERADSAWNNGSTGSTIAFQSTCGDTTDASLESIAEDLFNGFEQRKEIRNERIPFDGREGLSREIEGKVDGIVTHVRAIIYKKNSCSYVITFVTLTNGKVADNARKAAITGDVAEFERFAATFKAP